MLEVILTVSLKKESFFAILLYGYMYLVCLNWNIEKVFHCSKICRIFRVYFLVDENELVTLVSQIKKGHGNNYLSINSSQLCHGQINVSKKSRMTILIFFCVAQQFRCC